MNWRRTNDQRFMEHGALVIQTELQNTFRDAIIIGIQISRKIWSRSLPSMPLQQSIFVNCIMDSQQEEKIRQLEDAWDIEIHKKWRVVGDFSMLSRGRSPIFGMVGVEFSLALLNDNFDELERMLAPILRMLSIDDVREIKPEIYEILGIPFVKFPAFNFS